MSGTGSPLWVEGPTDRANARKLQLILKDAEDWRRKHGVQFETSKYVLIHFTRNHRQATKTSITAGGVKVKPASEAKYLGVILDQKLNFKSHLQYITKKGTKAAMALSGIAKSNWGVQYQQSRQLFKAVIATRTDYAALVWHRPKSDQSMATNKQNRKLTKVQRLAMKAIPGCYKTTPTTSMELETGLEPLEFASKRKSSSPPHGYNHSQQNILSKSG